MIGWLFGLGSAVLYGMSDFVGGLASRRSHFVVVALLGQCAGLIASALAGLMIGAESIPHSDLWWGALSGLGTAVGMAFLFRGLSRGAMSVIVPVSAVTGVSIPVLFGVVVEGNGRHCSPGSASWSPFRRCGWWPGSRAETPKGSGALGSVTVCSRASESPCSTWLSRMRQRRPDCGRLRRDASVQSLS